MVVKKIRRLQREFLCGMRLQIGVEFKQHIISQWRNSFGLVQGKETKLMWWKNVWLAALWTTI